MRYEHDWFHAIELGWPATHCAVIRSIGPDMKVKSVTLLATGKPVAFSQQADGLHLDVLAVPAAMQDMDRSGG